MIVASDGNYFATSDTSKAVCLFKKDYRGGDLSGIHEWKFQGKLVAHEVDIVSICFGYGLDTNGGPMLRLFSVGKDRRVFEYDMYNSDYGTLKPLKYFSIE